MMIPSVGVCRLLHRFKKVHMCYNGSQVFLGFMLLKHLQNTCWSTLNIRFSANLKLFYERTHFAGKGDLTNTTIQLQLSSFLSGVRVTTARVWTRMTCSPIVLSHSRSFKCSTRLYLLFLDHAHMNIK